MDGGISSLIVAVIGAAAAGLGLVISKENKISEFRQAWIDGLRKDLSELMTYYCQLDGSLIEDVNNREIVDRINLSASNIKLRLSSNNPTKHEKALLALINREILSSLPELPHAVFRKRYFSYSSMILKSEWNRVKKGEMKYNICSYISAAVLLISLGAFTVYTYHHWKIIIQFLIK